MAWAALLVIHFAVVIIKYAGVLRKTGNPLGDRGSVFLAFHRNTPDESFG
jgi:hypothetical protein